MHDFRNVGAKIGLACTADGYVPDRLRPSPGKALVRGLDDGTLTRQAVVTDVVYDNDRRSNASMCRPGLPVSVRHG